MEVSGETPERMGGRQYASGGESQGLATPVTSPLLAKRRTLRGRRSAKGGPGVSVAVRPALTGRVPLQQVWQG
jgi:hypothetical protein